MNYQNDFKNRIFNGIEIENLKKGEYFSFVGHKKIYSYQGYDRFNRKYSYYGVDDVNSWYYCKKGKLVTTNIDY